MFQRERESLDKQFKAISAKVLEAKHKLDELYFNETQNNNVPLIVKLKALSNQDKNIKLVSSNN